MKSIDQARLAEQPILLALGDRVAILGTMNAIADLVELALDLITALAILGVGRSRDRDADSNIAAMRILRICQLLQRSGRPV